MIVELVVKEKLNLLSLEIIVLCCLRIALYFTNSFMFLLLLLLLFLFLFFVFVLLLLRNHFHFNRYFINPTPLNGNLMSLLDHNLIDLPNHCLKLHNLLLLNHHFNWYLNDPLHLNRP